MQRVGSGAGRERAFAAQVVEDSEAAETGGGTVIGLRELLDDGAFVGAQSHGDRPIRLDAIGGAAELLGHGH